MLLEVGTITRAHGLRGQVVVALTSNRTERVTPGARLETDGGALQVVDASPAPGGAGADRWIVSFQGVAGREAAERLRGTVLRAEPLDDPDALWVHELIGSRVRDREGGDLGLVTDVLANPASDLLLLEGGGMIPLRFVLEREAGLITVDIPVGLLDP